MHGEVVAGFLQIDERRRRDADLSIEHIGLGGCDCQSSLCQAETCGQRLKPVLCAPQTLEMDITRVGDVARLDRPCDGNAQSSSTRQVYRFLQLEGRRQYPHSDAITHLPREVHLQGAAQVNV